MRVYLVRHGQDDPSVRGGWSNQPLTPEGHKQAETLAERILTDKISVERVYSSDLPRAMQTADPIAKALGSTVIPAPQFREVNNGDLAGMDNTLALEKYPGLFWNTLAWEQHYPNGESPREFYGRIKAAWAELVESKEENILLVTHSGVIHVILSILSGSDYSNRAVHPKITHAELITIEL